MTAEDKVEKGDAMGYSTVEDIEDATDEEDPSDTMDLLRPVPEVSISNSSLAQIVDVRSNQSSKASSNEEDPIIIDDFDSDNSDHEVGHDSTEHPKRSKQGITVLRLGQTAYGRPDSVKMARKTLLERRRKHQVHQNRRCEGIQGKGKSSSMY
ncbi:MAG: hypothetical protein M1814_006521 [Vezdaea aestivalis]|nr:MAG: hypothetical protein M1814_006521 [Vezdaea aestivalis]